MGIPLLEIFREILFRNRDRHAIPPMDGVLNPNDALEQSPVVADGLDQPDDIAVDDKGQLYISEGKRVLKLSGDEFKETTVYAELEGSIGSIRFHADGRLMACVEGIGLCLIDDRGNKTWVKEIEGTPLRCLNSAVAGANGEIYIADGSAYYQPSDWIWDLMEKHASGRVLRYDPVSNKGEVLLSGLGYPYGLTLSADGQSVIFSESWRHRVSQFPVKGIGSEDRRVLIPNLPGYPGRIERCGKGGYWMCLFAMRTELVEFILTEDKYRREMMRTIDPRHWVRPALSSGEDFLEPIQFGGIRVLGIKKPWAPPRSYGLVVKLDEGCQIVKSFHSRADGMRHGITGLAEHDGILYVVSKGSGAVLKLES